MAKRLLSTVLLTSGVILVAAGLSAALDFTPLGIVASVAVVVALLYAGAVWFGPAAAPPASAGIFLFDRTGRLVQGPAVGTSLLAHFPDSIRSDIDRHCAAALAGHASRFVCNDQGRLTAFEAVPVRGADGAIVFGVLITGAPVSIAQPA